MLGEKTKTIPNVTATEIIQKKTDSAINCTIRDVLEAPTTFLF